MLLASPSADWQVPADVAFLDAVNPPLDFGVTKPSRMGEIVIDIDARTATETWSGPVEEEEEAEEEAEEEVEADYEGLVEVAERGLSNVSVLSSQESRLEAAQSASVVSRWGRFVGMTPPSAVRESQAGQQSQIVTEEAEGRTTRRKKRRRRN